jgi:hypothetical protein
MRNLTVLFISFLCVSNTGFAQKTDTLTHHRAFIDFAGTIGNDQGSVSAAYTYNWKLGEKRKLELGVGARYTGYLGKKKDYITAPASLARTTRFPFLIVFAGQREENFDTLTVQRPFVNSLNITFNLGYALGPKWYAGTNIDVIGFSFGPSTNAVFKSNGNTTTEPKAKVVPFNLLLTGDNDRGSLNSEFFVSYKLSERCSIKGIYQFLFTEYTSTTVQQIAPDGSSNNRFRNKANNFGIGISYSLK